MLNAELKQVDGSERTSGVETFMHKVQSMFDFSTADTEDKAHIIIFHMRNPVGNSRASCFDK